MPLQKILAPFLPGTQQRAPNRDGFALSKEQVLSPSLPFSPPKMNVQYRDPVIGLSTVDEDSSSARSNDTELDADIEKNSEEEEQCSLTPDTFTPSDQQALVLHESPTSFELSNNDVIIESVPRMIEEEYFDQDMMRTSTTSLAMYQSPHMQAGIDFTPPPEFLADEESPMSAEPSTINMIVPPVSPESDVPKTQPVQEIVKPVPGEFIQSTYTEPIQDIFCSPISERPSHFAMETSFHKTESDFKLRCMKMIRNAKGLVCKPESPKHLGRTKSDATVQYEKSILSPKVDLHPIDTNLKAVKSVKEEEKASTPIYKRHQKSQLPSFQSPNAAPAVPYKSPVVGTDAYEIKLLCEQSFFGC